MYSSNRIFTKLFRMAWVHRDKGAHAKTLREKDPGSMRTSELCPIVNWNSNGEITSVVACYLR